MVSGQEKRLVEDTQRMEERIRRWHYVNQTPKETPKVNYVGEKMPPLAESVRERAKQLESTSKYAPPAKEAPVRVPPVKEIPGVRRSPEGVIIKNAPVRRDERCVVMKSVPDRSRSRSPPTRIWAKLTLVASRTQLLSATCPNARGATREKTLTDV